MGDIGPCELVEGRIVPMSPSGGLHGKYEFTVAHALGAFAGPRRLGQVFVGETGLYTRRGPDTVRGADVAFLSRDRLPGNPPRGFLTVAPELVVEVVSDDSKWVDLRRKIDEYFAIGVERVWIVEPDLETVLVYRGPADMVKLGKGDVLRGEGVLDGFELPLATLFE